MHHSLHDFVKVWVGSGFVETLLCSWQKSYSFLNDAFPKNKSKCVLMKSNEYFFNLVNGSITIYGRRISQDLSFKFLDSGSHSVVVVEFRCILCKLGCHAEGYNHIFLNTGCWFL